MINCKLINNTQPLHLSKQTDPKYIITTTSFYVQKFEECIENNKEFVATFRLDPVIHQAQDFDIVIWKFHTPGISPTPGLLSLEYDMIEDFLRDWQILGVYDIFEQPEQTRSGYVEDWRTKELKGIVDINYTDIK